MKGRRIMLSVEVSEYGGMVSIRDPRDDESCQVLIHIDQVDLLCKWLREVAIKIAEEQ